MDQVGLFADSPEDWRRIAEADEEELQNEERLLFWTIIALVVLIGLFMITRSENTELMKRVTALSQSAVPKPPATRWERGTPVP